MRSNEKDPEINYHELIDNCKVIGDLTNVQPKSVEHMLKLNYLVSLHKMSNEVLDADSKLNTLKIEIPYFGALTLKIENNKIIESSFECEDYLIDDINKTITTGESRLISEARQRVGERINKRYQELL